MASSQDTHHCEEYFYNGEVLKQVKTKGKGDQVCENCKVMLIEQIYTESGSLVSGLSEKEYRIISYPAGAIKSPYDTILLSMRIGEEAWVRFPYTHHNISEASWEVVWYNITIISVDAVPNVSILPQYLPFLREHKLGAKESILKRVITEGHGENPTVNSRLTYNYEIILDNGCSVDSKCIKGYLLSRNPSPAMHPGLHLALYSVRTGEKSLIKLPPGYHVSEKFLNEPVWVKVFIESIDFCQDLVYPQKLPYLREVYLKLDGSVLKRIVKEGHGPVMQNMVKVWVTIEGRLEDGLQFQKPKDEVINLIGSKIYSEAMVLGINSMKRGEVAWIKASPDTHLYKEGYENETLWFLFEVKEYLENYTKLHSKMTILERLYHINTLLDIAKRLYTSNTKKDCKIIYNDIITSLKLKKDGFSELDEQTKVKFIDAKGRAMMNLALIFIKEVEESDKEDAKIKTLQKVLDMCNELISYDKNSIKAYYRRGTAYFIKSMHTEALQDFKKVLEIDPVNKDALKHIKKLNQLTQKIIQKEKKAFSGIFNSNRWDQESERDDKLQKSKQAQLKLQEDLWRNEQHQLRLNQISQQNQYEKMIENLEKGVIIDTEDITDPITEILLDPSDV
jgi:tetratricopeptide (TPR) repeat protein